MGSDHRGRGAELKRYCLRPWPRHTHPWWNWDLWAVVPPQEIVPPSCSCTWSGQGVGLALTPVSIMEGWIVHLLRLLQCPLGVSCERRGAWEEVQFCPLSSPAKPAPGQEAEPTPRSLRDIAVHGSPGCGGDWGLGGLSQPCS